MATSIVTDELHRLLDQGAQLLDVMPDKEFLEEHLPGAVNVPLTDLDADTAATLDRGRPVVVYCFDYQ